jgi:hypothetical protein
LCWLLTFSLFGRECTFAQGSVDRLMEDCGFIFFISLMGNPQ